MSTPTLRFPEFNEPWRNTSLGDECSFSKGKGISKADIDHEGATPCVRYGQLYTDYGTVIGDAISRTSVDQSLLRISEGGEVIIPASGEDSKDIATAAVVINKGIALGGDLNILTSDHNGHFLAEYLSGKKRADLAVLAQGNSVVHLYPKQLSGVSIALPSLPEQRRIADALSAVDAKINLLTRKRDNLARFKAGLMQKIFSQEVRFTREDGSTYPDWEEKKLNDMANVTMGQSPPSSSYNDNGVGLPLIQGNADTALGYSAPRRHTSQPTKKCKEGDILLSVRAPVGDVSISVGDACIGRGIAAIRTKSGHDQDYVHQFLLSAQGEWQKLSQGSTFTAVSGPDVRSISIPSPCREEQSRMASALSDLDRKGRQLSHQITTMQSFKKGLLQQMFV